MNTKNAVVVVGFDPLQPIHPDFFTPLSETPLLVGTDCVEFLSSLHIPAGPQVFGSSVF